MKEIKPIPPVYLEEYGVSVTPRLTLAQIQNIINSTISYKTYSEREQNIKAMLLCYCTDIEEDKIFEADYDLLESSGLIDAVKKEVINFHEIYKGIEYHESVAKGLKEIAEAVPDLQDALKKYGKNYK